MERYCFVVAGRITAESTHDDLRAIVDVLRATFDARGLSVEMTLHVKESAARVLGAVERPEDEVARAGHAIRAVFPGLSMHDCERAARAVLALRGQ